jgi:peptidoglycan/xylan/chitin deacetylase (PgdA/CDA1 family)
MTRKKTYKLLRKVRHFLVSVFVLAVFFLPLLATARWVEAMVTGNDPRKTISINHSAATQSDEIRVFSEPLITITFDDGWASIYDEAFPLMEKHGIKSTQYLLGNTFDNFEYMSVDQAISMRQSGHDIAAHSMTHPNLTKSDESDLEWEVGESKSVLIDKLGQVKDFASPLGASDRRTIDVIKRHFRSNRNTAADPAVIGPDDINLPSNFNRYNINCYTVRRSTKPEDLRRLIEYAKSNNGWVVLNYHQVDDGNDFYGVSPEAFERQLKLIKSYSVKSPTMRQVLDSMEPKVAEY